MSVHAKKAPSAAYRWMTCTASLSIDVSHLKDKSSYSGELGTALHECAANVLLNEHTAAQSVGHMYNGIKIEKAHVKDIIKPYLEFVKKQCENEEDIVRVEVFVEERAFLFEDCWGTADLVIVLHRSDDTVILKVIDLKTGSGTKVSPIENKQLYIYGAGIYKDLALLYDVAEVQVGICQPPFNVYAMYGVGTERLDEFTDEVREVINRIDAGEVEFKPSDENCQWCPASSLCPKVHEAVNQAAADDFGTLKSATLKSLSERMALVPMLKRFIKDVEEESFNRLIGGKKIKGYKLVQGRGSRQWKYSPATMENKLKELGIPATLSHKSELLSPAQMEKAIEEWGRRNPPSIGKLIKKVPGGATIADADDKREEYDANAGAKRDFANTKKK